MASGPDCINDAIAPKLGLHPQKNDESQWAGQCPRCRANFSFRVGDMDGVPFVWTCHRKPAPGGRAACTQEQIKKAMIARGVSADLLGRVPGRRRKTEHSPETKRLIDFIVTTRFGDAAMKIGLLRELGVSPAETRRRLNLAKSTYYDAMAKLGQSG